MQETYPSTPPVWFADAEDLRVTNAVQLLSNTTGLDNHVSRILREISFANHRSRSVVLFQILNQVYILIKELCQSFQVEVPLNLDSLRLGVSKQFCLISEKQNNMKSADSDDDDEDEDEDLEEDIPLATEDNETAKDKVN